MKLLIFACALGYSKCIDDKPLVRSISKKFHLHIRFKISHLI